MTEALSEPFFLRALLVGLLASIACGVIGSFVVVKRIASISGGIAHAALGGVGLGYFCGFSPVLGAIAVAVLSGLYIGRAYLHSYESLDTLIAMVWSFGMAVGIFLVSLVPGYAPGLNDYMFGSIVFVPREYVALVLLLDVLILAAIWGLFVYFKAIAFDEEYALVRGVAVERYFLLLLVLIALTVVTLMKVVGVLLVIALLTVPAVVARMWTETLERMMLLAVAVAALSTTAGLLLAYGVSLRFAVNAPSGPLIIMFSLGCFGLSRVLRAMKRERG